MSLRELGIYIDEVTGKSYSVLERTQNISSSTLSAGIKRKGNFEYVTSCGIDLEPLDDNLDEFELLQIDGVIKKQE